MGEGLPTEDTRHSLPSAVTELTPTLAKADRTQKGGLEAVWPQRLLQPVSIPSFLSPEAFFINMVGS